MRFFKLDEDRLAITARERFLAGLARRIDSFLLTDATLHSCDREGNIWFSGTVEATSSSVSLPGGCDDI